MVVYIHHLLYQFITFLYNIVNGIDIHIFYRNVVKFMFSTECIASETMSTMDCSGMNIFMFCKQFDKFAKFTYHGFQFRIQFFDTFSSSKILTH